MENRYKKQKVVHIVESFGAGVFNFLVDLVNGMSSDFEIVVAYGERKETPKDFKNYFKDNVKFIKIENFTRNINLKKEIKALKEIKELIKEEKPDIVHLHSSKAGILGRLAINGNKVKMFYNPHGFSFLKQDDSKIKRTIYWLIEKTTAIINKRCTIVGCSNGEYLEAKKLNENSICINNGINIEKLQEEIKDLAEKDINYNLPKICTIGRIECQKNPELFNEIAKQLPELEFTWIGDGNLKEKLTSSNIKVTGWKTRKEVLEELNNQDIFILTSLWEGLPISLLEAMYMKKICIVSNCIGNRDVIISTYNGYIANNLQEYVAIINNNLQSNEIATIIRKNANSDSINIYTTKRMAAQYANKYSYT